ncbi:peptide/nickel transport system permease protein [Humitalea rosea]|uniref:Peptide/nickel transport system permease protein n=1 Tax=Humitalea rosea TaxID=990373 RepID=A0A2W7IZB8_9PROT|nr:ABC transporter permease [Humitalea rosea]PZW44777.1 peptide/nickel transport system permease protein [Humitalea rosea]
MRFLIFFGQRLALAVPTVLILSVLVFLLQRLLPGDPALAMGGDEIDLQGLEEIRHKYGLDLPIHLQYFRWLGSALVGDLGISLRNSMGVTELLLGKLVITLQLAFASMIIAVVVGIPLGVLAASRHGTWLDTATSAVSLTSISIPHFWLGILLVLAFSVNLQWFPSSGYVPFWEDPRRSAMGFVLPSIVLGTGIAGVLMRHTRSAMLQSLGADYVRTARAKGLSERRVVLRHALRNALVPVVTLGAIEFGHLLAGAVLTEQIFSIPGFGKLLVDGVLYRDYAVVQGLVLVSAVLFILVSLTADVLYFVINPRLRG